MSFHLHKTTPEKKTMWHTQVVISIWFNWCIVMLHEKIVMYYTGHNPWTKCNQHTAI